MDFLPESLPSVFVSHCSREGDLAHRVIAALRERLGGRVRVLLDEDVFRAGDRWRDELWAWWSTCDAAVIVCSTEALESDWVLIETVVLKRRVDTSADFRLFPLLIDPVTVAALK